MSPFPLRFVVKRSIIEQRNTILYRKNVSYNPEVVGSSPASATKICPETGWFLDFFRFASGKFEFFDVDFLGLGVNPCFAP